MYVSYLATMRAMEDSIIIRIASINDAESIRNIYNHEVLNSTASFDLVERTVQPCLQAIDDAGLSKTEIVALYFADSFGSLLPTRVKEISNILDIL